MGWRIPVAGLALVLSLVSANDSGLFECPKGELERGRRIKVTLADYDCLRLIIRLAAKITVISNNV